MEDSQRAKREKLLTPPLSEARKRELAPLEQRLAKLEQEKDRPLNIEEALLKLKISQLRDIGPAAKQQVEQLDELLLSLHNAISEQLGRERGPRPSNVLSSFREGPAWTTDSRPRLPTKEAELMELHEKLNATPLPADPRQRAVLEVDRWLVTSELGRRFTRQVARP